jgi:GNAT superfamily N-acetyltransferase
VTVPPSPQASSAVADVSEPELVRLRDGSLVTLRPTTVADEPALRSFLAGLCLEARRLRFFSGAVDLSSAAHLSADTSAGRFGLVAHDEMGALVAHALYIQLDRTRAEVAVEVADHLHDRGLGTILIERLGTVAERHDVTRFVAEVLPENRAMLDVFRDSFDAHVACRDGVDRVEFPTSAWRIASERFPEQPRSGDPGAPVTS